MIVRAWGRMLALGILAVGSTVVSGVQPSASQASGATIWLQTIDSCRQAVGSAVYVLVGPGTPPTASSSQVTQTTPPSKPVTVINGGGCPIQRGNCALSSHPGVGCVEWTAVQPGTYTIVETTRASIPPPGQAYAPCTGGSACRVETGSVTVNPDFSVTATTTTWTPNNKLITFPSGGTFTATQTDPIVMHDFGMIPGQCDGDSDADDIVGPSPTSFCSYLPEAAEATACQPFPWSCNLTVAAALAAQAAEPKQQPSLTSTAQTPVTIGNPIFDVAHLTGGTSGISGTITFQLFSDPACSSPVTTALNPVTVTGNGDYNSGNFTPTAVGTYFWTASYSGDGKNQVASTACGAANESSVVNGATSSISTTQNIFPQDSATISVGAGGTPTGSVTFQLFAPSDTTCAASPVYSQTVSLTNGLASTSNTTFSVSSATAGTYRWAVSYPGDAGHLGATSTCGTEQFTVTVANG